MRLHGNDGQTWGRAVWPRQSSQPVDLERDGWDCDTACEKVVELVLALASTLESDMITRGDMAILLDGSLDYLEYLQTL